MGWRSGRRTSRNCKRRSGRIAAYRSAVHAVTLSAIHALDAAWQAAGTPPAHHLSLAATLAASEAKVVADEVAATLASLLIDVSSGSGVSTRTALNRLPPTGAFF